MNNDIIEELDGIYYRDETDNLVGPFNTLQQAELALSAALKWLDEDRKPLLRKMKDNMGQ